MTPAQHLFVFDVPMDDDGEADWDDLQACCCMTEVVDGWLAGAGFCSTSCCHA